MSAVEYMSLVRILEIFYFGVLHTERRRVKGSRVDSAPQVSKNSRPLNLIFIYSHPFHTLQVSAVLWSVCSWVVIITYQFQTYISLEYRLPCKDVTTFLSDQIIPLPPRTTEHSE